MGANNLTSNKELTTTEKELLRHYREHLDKFGAPPSLRQLGTYLSIAHSAVSHALKRLKLKGYMTPQKITQVRLRLSAKGKKVEL